MLIIFTMYTFGFTIFMFYKFYNLCLDEARGVRTSAKVCRVDQSIIAQDNRKQIC